MLKWLKRGFILGVTAVTAYVAYTRFRPRPIPVESLRTDGKFITVEGLRIYYRTAGAGPPLILIHGIGASLFAWRLVFDQFAENHTVYALDLKGHGLSDKPNSGDYSPFGMADLVAHFMDVLDIDSAKIIGLSMGGAVGTALAIRHPLRVQQLVLISAAGYPLNYHVMPLIVRFASTSLGSAFVAFVLRQRKSIEWYLRSCFYDPDGICTPEMIDGYFLPLLTPGLGGVVPLLARDFGQTSLAHRLKEVAAPTLIIWGQYDAVIPMHWGYRFQRDIANAQLVVFPKCGHCPHEEYPQQFLEVVNGFFQGGIVDSNSQPEGTLPANP